MQNDNVIARLYPDNKSPFDRAAHTIQMRENEALHIPPALRRQDHAQHRHLFTDLDVPYEHEGVAFPRRHVYNDALELRFDHARKHRRGFLVGRAPDCDVVLPSFQRLGGTSRYQCLITLGDDGSLIIQDLRSPEEGKPGTMVEYDGEGGFQRRGFTWILSSSELAHQSTKIVVSFHRHLKFEIVVPVYDHASPWCAERIAKFHDSFVAENKGQGVESPDFSLASNHAADAEATRDSGLGANSILIRRRELGRGAQAVVSYAWDVSTGAEYAAKDPMDGRFWPRLREEARLLNEARHEHIVEFVHLVLEPTPQLILKYIPLGNLHAQAQRSPITSTEILDIARQTLSALTYLHGRPSPIAHRDIKPENILVQSRDPLHIRLSDFGLSKESQNVWRTRCGTQYYAAPEVFVRDAYDASVDIWSLGVVLYGFAHCLPVPEEEFNMVVWARGVVQGLKSDLEEEGCPLLALIAASMLIVEPSERASAEECYNEARQLTPTTCCGRQPTSKWATSMDTGESECLGQDQMSLDNAETRSSVLRARQFAEDGMHYTRDDGRYARSDAPAPDLLLSDVAAERMEMQKREDIANCVNIMTTVHSTSK